LKKTKTLESELDLSRETLEKRNKVITKIRKLGHSSHSAELVARQLEVFCQLIIQSSKSNNYG